MRLILIVLLDCWVTSALWGVLNLRCLQGIQDPLMSSGWWQLQVWDRKESTKLEMEYFWRVGSWQVTVEATEMCQTIPRCEKRRGPSPKFLGTPALRGGRDWECRSGDRRGIQRRRRKTQKPWGHRNVACWKCCREVSWGKEGKLSIAFSYSHWCPCREPLQRLHKGTHWAGNSPPLPPPLAAAP